MARRGGGVFKQPRGPQDPSEWKEVEDEEEPALYATDDFRIRVMKVLRCSKKYCHDWTRCPFAHPGEKASRREPTSGVYTGIACPDMRKEQRCPRGPYCPYAHNVFEYWLHPTRYRTALCRDVDKCTRKICFFAHNMQEIRTNLERPYVSPEQLMAATQAAAADHRVQAKYLAAGENKGNTRGNIFSGIGEEDVGQPMESLLPLPRLETLSLAAPPSTSQRVETINAFSSMIRGSPDAVTRPSLQITPSLGDMESGSGTGPGGLAGNPLSDVGGDGTPSAEQLGHELQTEQPHNLPTDDSLLSSKKAAQNQPKPVRSQTASAAAIHSWGSQQNLLNAAAHLSNDKVGKEAALWSTPRGTLDFNALYSSASTISDRNMSIESMNPNNRSLDMRYGQRVRRGKQGRRPSSTSIGQASISSNPYSGIQTGSGTLTGASYPGQQSLYTASSTSTFAPTGEPGFSMVPGLYTESLNSGSLQSDYTQMLQREAFHQQQQDYLGLSQHNANLLYEQQLRTRLQNTMNQGLGGQMPSVPLAEELRQRELAAQSVVPETGTFDLRFGGLGENQGLLVQPTVDPAADTANMYSKYGTLYSQPAPELQKYLQNDEGFPRAQPVTSQSYPGSLNASILQAIQAHGLRSAEMAVPAPNRRRSTESSHTMASLDADFAARLGFTQPPYGRSPPSK